MSYLVTHSNVVHFASKSWADAAMWLTANGHEGDGSWQIEAKQHVDMAVYR